MISKILNYVLIVLGLVGISIGFDPVYNIAVSLFPFIKSFDYRYIVGGGIILIIIGVILMRKSGGGRNKVSEVPIFQGKDVVGYRRTNRK